MTCDQALVRRIVSGTRSTNRRLALTKPLLRMTPSMDHRNAVSSVATKKAMGKMLKPRFHSDMKSQTDISIIYYII
jgi:hypothetical protein